VAEIFAGLYVWTPHPSFAGHSPLAFSSFLIRESCYILGNVSESLIKLTNPQNKKSYFLFHTALHNIDVLSLQHRYSDFIPFDHFMFYLEIGCLVLSASRFFRLCNGILSHCHCHCWGIWSVRFWHWCCWRFRSSAVWLHVPGSLLDPEALQSLETLELLVQWHSVTSLKDLNP